MQSEIIQQFIASSKDNESFIGVRVYYDSDEYFVGFVSDYNDEMFTLQHITKNGDEDGLIFFNLEQLESIEMDDDYIRSIQFLYRNKKNLALQKIKSVEIPNQENWIYQVLLNEEIHSRIISINIGKGTVWSGFINDFDLDYLSLKIIDEKGNDQGSMLFRMRDIDSVYIDRLENRRRELLHFQWKKK